MNTVRVEEAVGMVLAHDLTKIVPGQFKGAAYKKGHIIRQEDVEALKSMGKNHINILELKRGFVHENEAAHRISRALSGEDVWYTEPSEGKIELKAKYRGIIKINVEALNQINDIADIVVATLHTNTLVEKEQKLAATRIIPLVIDEERIRQVEEIGKAYNNQIVTVKELKPLKTGVVIIGSEVYEGRVKDGFAPVMKEKNKHYGCMLQDIVYCPDDKGRIKEAMKEMLDHGVQVVFACGGMSVDADDLTPCAIREVSDEVVSYGIPALPGNMLMLAYKGEAAMLGIPAAAIFLKNTTLDFILPRILAGERLTKKDLAAYGHGGLCLGCEVCTFPICPYGK